VIIPAYRCPDFINQAVDSVTRQTFTDNEIIVVDDCSGDDIISRYQFPPSVQLIRRETNSGSASAPRNDGLRASRGRYLAFLDHDDIWLPEKLAAQVAVLEAQPEVGVTFCQCRDVDETLQPLVQRPPAVLAGDVMRQLLTSCVIRTPSQTLIRRTALEAAGGFDEAIHGGEDWDLWLRLAGLTQFHADPAYGILYRQYRGQTSKDQHRMRQGDTAVLEKTRVWLAAKRPDLLSCLRYRLAMLYYLFAKQQIARQEEPRAIYRTVKAAVASYPGALRVYQGFYRLVRYMLKRRLAGGKPPAGQHTGATR